MKGRGTRLLILCGVLVIGSDRIMPGKIKAFLISNFMADHLNSDHLGHFWTLFMASMSSASASVERGGRTIANANFESFLGDQTMRVFVTGATGFIAPRSAKVE